VLCARCERTILSDPARCWIDGIGPATRLEIQVPQPAITHTVTVQQFERWANGAAVNPDERIRKDQLKAILGGTAQQLTTVCYQWASGTAGP
jgi:hypothetical protein